MSRVGSNNKTVQRISWNFGLDDFLAVSWTPEGIILTPRGGDAPFGYGFPKRELSELVVDEKGNEFLIGGALINSPFGTVVATKEKEVLNQVIINQYENNCYLDKKEFITGLPTKEDLKITDKIYSPIIDFPLVNRRLREKIETKIEPNNQIGQRSYVCYWPIFFNPPTCEGDSSYWYDIFNAADDIKKGINEPGLNHYDNREGGYCFNPFIDEAMYSVNKASLNTVYEVKYRQYETKEGNSYLREPLIYEEESVNWFCHWPEELLYDNKAYEMIFHLTNEYRDAVGRKPVFREIRGYANTALMALIENQLAETLNHDSSKFRQGYHLMIDRFQNAATNIEAGGENLEGGYSIGLGIASGRKSAEGWKDSPPHYANMTNTNWDDPEGSTSHEIFGAFPGKYNEVRGVPKDQPGSGGFWSQVFTKRKYWLLAGSVGQQTDAGRVSFFTYASLIGNLFDDDEYKLRYCYQGRTLVNHPLREMLKGYRNGITTGVCLYYKDELTYVRVVIMSGDYYTFRNKKIQSFTKPLRNAACKDWVEESSVNIGDDSYTQDQCTFNEDGSRGVFVIMNKSTTLASHLLSVKKDDEIDTTFYEMEVFTINNGMISSDHVIDVPDAHYEVSTQDYVVPSSDPQTIIRWVDVYKQYSSGEINYHPYFDPETNEIVYLKFKYDYSCNQERFSFINELPPEEQHLNYLATCRDSKELVFPSGYRMVLAKQNLEDKGSVAEGVPVLDMVGECFCTAFLYLDPINEDMVYTKTTFRGEGKKVFGSMDIYVRHDGEEKVIKHWDEKLINPNFLIKPQIYGQWQIVPDKGFPNKDTLVLNVINPSVNQQIDNDGTWYPAFNINSGLWSCASFPTKIIYVGKIINDSMKVDLFFNFASFHSCNSGYSMNFTYAANLNLIRYNRDGIKCNAARYKDRFVTQIEFDQDFKTPLWTFPYDQKYILYANFPLEDEVGFPLTHIEPFGVA